jgi:hypothetical protein
MLKKRLFRVFPWLKFPSVAGTMIEATNVFFIFGLTILPKDCKPQNPLLCFGQTSLPKDWFKTKPVTTLATISQERAKPP